MTFFSLRTKNIASGENRSSRNDNVFELLLYSNLFFSILRQTKQVTRQPILTAYLSRLKLVICVQNLWKMLSGKVSRVVECVHLRYFFNALYFAQYY